jgi:hypothetical protein
MTMVPATGSSTSTTTRQSFVPRLAVLEFTAVFLLLSCASTRPPQRQRVRVVPGFSGTLQLTPCAAVAPVAEISADANGAANTAICPSADGGVVIVVVQGNREYTAAPQDIAIQRTGDGIPTSITVRMRP